MDDKDITHSILEEKGGNLKIMYKIK